MKSTALNSMGLALALFAGSSFVRGNVLLPGDSKVPDVFTNASYCGGNCNPLILDVIVGTYTIKDALNNVTQTGNYATAVLTDFTTGNLDFIYQFQPETGTDPFISEVSASAFGGFTTDVGYDANTWFTAFGPGNSAPTEVSRTAGAGNVVDFLFGTELTTGDTSDMLIVETNAKHYTAGSFGFIDNNTGNVAGFAPTVPEPTSILLFGGALALACSAIRRKLRSV